MDVENYAKNTFDYLISKMNYCILIIKDTHLRVASQMLFMSGNSMFIS